MHMITQQFLLLGGHRLGIAHVYLNYAHVYD